MRLFFVLICCLAIPLVARAADQDNQDNNKKEKQATQGQQPQPQQQQQQQTRKQGQQGKHDNANNASQPNNPSRLKGQDRHPGVNAQNANVPAVPSNTTGKVETKHNGTNTAAQPNNPPQSQDQHPGANAENTNVPTVQSNQIKVQAKHFNLANSPSPRIETVKFQQNFHIQGSENWQGQKYGAFQSYRGEWHDQGWWHTHYNRVVLISGGWYFWNAGYWAPAWGYDSAAAYYPYNGPIYGYNDLPPDQVIANVQSTLQAQGYYEGEVDGMLGPMTRAALASYQQNHGLYMTEAIDEPTLDSLGMS